MRLAGGCLVCSLTAHVLFVDVEVMNRPGMSGDFEPWEGWSHVREHV